LFKYSSTTADTFRIAGELIAKGVKPSDVAGKLFDNFSVNRLQLMKAVLATLKLYGENSIAIIHVTQDMFNETSTTPADTENFINYPRSLVSVKVVAFIKETRTDLISVSLRSKGKECDVAAIAAKFGGGGHRNAAGYKIQAAKLTDVLDTLLLELLPLATDH
jgi:phosphoesterase RecJ-like protein